MNSLSIIIVNWNSSDCLERCIQSIAQADKSEFELEETVIVDNASVAEEVEKLRTLKNYELKIRILKNQVNLGFAKACNLGAQGISSDYLLFLNPDTILQKDTLEKCMATMKAEKEKNTKAAVLGCRLVDEFGNTQRCCSRLPKLRFYLARCLGVNRIIKSQNQFMLEWDHTDSRYVDEVMGAFFLVDNQSFQELHGFDERFFVYYEEVDYCRRLKDRGAKVFYYSEASVYHEAGGSSKQVKAERLFYDWRSRYQYQQKHSGRAAAQCMKWITEFEYLIRRIQLRIAGCQSEIPNVKRAHELFKEWYHTR